MEIGILLLRLRKERRLSQAEVAEQFGVSQSAYCGWESERATPGVRHWLGWPPFWAWSCLSCYRH